MLAKPLFVLVGASGSGKSSLMRDLCDKLGLVPVESYTNRPRRYEGESGHNFVTSEELAGMTFLNSTVFGGYTYGMTAEQIAVADICVMEPSGAQGIRAQLEPDRWVVLIGVESAAGDIRSRLSATGASAADIEARMSRDAAVFENLGSFCDRVFLNPNDEYDDVLQYVMQYIEQLQPLGGL